MLFFPLLGFLLEIAILQCVSVELNMNRTGMTNECDRTKLNGLLPCASNYDDDGDGEDEWEGHQDALLFLLFVYYCTSF